MALIGTLTDTFPPGSALAAGWGANGAGAQDGQLYVNCSSNAGAPVYSAARRSDGWTWSGSAIAFYDVVMPAGAGTDTANAQYWMMDPGTANTVDRMGWEYVAATNSLVGRSQTGAGYTTTDSVTLAYDPVAHRNLRLTHTGTSILFETSPDGLTWTTQKTVTALPAWSTKTTLVPSVEGSRGSGTNDTLRVGAVNVAPVALPTVAPTAVDPLQRRTLAELRAWEAWNTTAGSRGFVGEFGWVTKFSQYGDATQGAQWAGLGDAYLTELDVAGLGGSVWAAGRNWGQGYPLGSFVGVNAGDPLTIANTDAAAVIPNHRTRGTGTATRWRAVGLSGHEQGITINGGGTVRTGSPLVHTPADFGFLAANGVDTVRLALAWERLQPTLSTALDATALGVLDGMLLAARQAGVRVILDCHNYGRYTNADGSVVALGSGLSNAALSDFWTRISTWVRATATRSGTVVGYGIQNEPHDLVGGAATWQTTSQAVLTAIRGGGDNRLLLVAGYQFASLTAWATNHPSGWITDTAAGIAGGGFAYEAHHYWDTTSTQGSRSGTYQGSGGILTYATERTAAAAVAPGVVHEMHSAAMPANSAGANLTDSTAITVAAGDLLVVKAYGASAQNVIVSVSGGGLTWTTQRDVPSGGSHSPARISTAPVTAAGTCAVVVTFSSSATSTSTVGFIVERWEQTTLAATPATGAVAADTTAPYQTTISTTATNSTVTWLDADYTAANGTPITYSPAATGDASYYANTIIGAYSAYAPSPGTGSQTVGMSAPAGQNATIVVLEVVPQSLAVTATDRPSGAEQGTPGDTRVGDATRADIAAGSEQGAPTETPVARPQGPIDQPSGTESGGPRDGQAVGAVRKDTPTGSEAGSPRETQRIDAARNDTTTGAEQAGPAEAPIEDTVLTEAPSSEEAGAPLPVELPLPPTLTLGQVGPTELDLSIANAPRVSEATLRWYGWLGSAFIDGDAAAGYPLLRFLEAGGRLLQNIEDITRDENTAPGWSTVFDLTRAPTYALPWLGQTVGVDVDPTIPDADQRAQIVDESGYTRGTLTAIRQVALSWLTGPTPTVEVTERDGNEWTLTVAVYAAQLVGRTYASLGQLYPTYQALSAAYPSYQAFTVGYSELYAALEQVKPAGLLLNLIVRTGPSYGALSASYGTYAALTGRYAAYGAMTGAQPVYS